MKHGSWRKLLTEKAFRDCNDQDRTQLLMNPEAQVIPLQHFCFLHVFIYWRSEEDNTHGSDSLQKLGLSCYVGLRIESRSSGFWQAPLAVALPRWPPTLVVWTQHIHFATLNPNAHCLKQFCSAGILYIMHCRVFLDTQSFLLNHLITENTLNNPYHHFSTIKYLWIGLC